MQGLQAGLPFAALAAVARATSVIGGSQGEDRGSDVALPVDNKFRSEVNDYHSDDHSLDLDAKETVVEAGHVRRPQHHKARGQVLESDDGVSDGSSYMIPQVHVESKNENSYHEDNHSVALEEDLVQVVPPHGRGHSHHARGEHEEVDVIGGPEGVDTGNTFAMPITNKFSSTVNDAYLDDHSRDFDIDTTIVKPKSHPPNHFKARGQREDVDVIGGPEGVDRGNDVGIPITNKFSSTVNEAYVDDHSRDIDVDTTIVNPVHHGPAHLKARGDYENVDVIGGPEGVDRGNDVSIPITNKFSSTVNDYYQDDHSRDIDRDTTIVYPHHHKVREEHEHVDVIGGPGGVDTGNTFDMPITNKFSSVVNDAYVDDHSLDFSKDTAIVYPHHHKREHVDVIGGPGGVDTGNTFDMPITNTFSSEVNDYYQDDHSRDLDFDKTVVHPHHRRAPDEHEHVDVIGGPAGVDTGNTFAMPIINKFSSEVNDYSEDDHSRDLDIDTTVVHPHHKREHVDVIGGPGGIDTGNTFDMPITNKFSSEVNDYYQDDHSWDVDVDTKIVRAHHKRQHGAHVDVIGGPEGVDTGNTFDMPITSEFSSEVNDYYQDD
ncbi:putative GPI anchored protein, partial [Aspergillus saccharolyticus JOP 1030-1]